MKSLEEFDQNLESLGGEIAKLKSIREAYQKVAELSVGYIQIVDQLKNAIQSVDSTKESISEFLDETKLSVTVQQNLIEKKLDEVKSTIDIKQNSIEKIISNKMDEVNDSNKHFYKDFVDTVQIRLDNNKGELRQLIEHERSETKSMIDDQTKTFEKFQNNQMAKIEQQINSTRNISLWFGVGMVILCLVIIVLVLFLK